MDSCYTHSSYESYISDIGLTNLAARSLLLHYHVFHITIITFMIICMIALSFPEFKILPADVAWEAFGTDSPSFLIVLLCSFLSICLKNLVWDPRLVDCNRVHNFPPLIFFYQKQNAFIKIN